MFKRILCLVFLVLTAVILKAQDTGLTPYDTALKRILAAEQTQAVDLDLSNLGLDELPPEIGHLINLQTLSANNNLLTELPPEIGQMERLGSLYLGSNRLTSLPHEIGNLSNLYGLYISDNELTSLPAEIGQLDLVMFFASQNPFSDFPEDVRKQGPDGILLYLQEQSRWEMQKRLIAGVILLCAVTSMASICVYRFHWQPHKSFC